MIEADLKKCAKMLEALLYMSGSSGRQLEERLDYGAGTINRLFRGTIELKLRHVLLILETLDIPPWQFFREAFHYEEEAQQGKAIAVRLLELLEPSPRKAGRAISRRPSVLSDEDLERRLRAALARMGFVPPPSGGG